MHSINIHAGNNRLHSVANKLQSLTMAHFKFIQDNGFDLKEWCPPTAESPSPIYDSSPSSSEYYTYSSESCAYSSASSHVETSNALQAFNSQITWDVNFSFIDDIPAILPIQHPTSSADPERDIVVEAMEIAGLPVVLPILEPTDHKKQTTSSQKTRTE